MIGIALALCDAAMAANAPAADQTPPPWAFAVNPVVATPATPAAPADPTLWRVPGSTARFTRAQASDYFNVPDWHPEGHAAMPGIVAHGRAPDVIACGYCHLPNGQGRPENSGIAGLPAPYIIQQLKDFAGGKRHSSVPLHQPAALMTALAAKVSAADSRAAAEYYSQLKPKPWIRVVEAATVPRTRVAGWMLVPVGDGAREPIGQRIVELAENLRRTELRDDASGFVAYVPPGSIARGKLLVTTGGAGKTSPCVSCHGPNLKGLATAPHLAGRSPSCLVRQLFDIQHGTRRGAAVTLMKANIVNLTLDDMVAIAAYTASLAP
jgi:cytochrome c553